MRQEKKITKKELVKDALREYNLVMIITSVFMLGLCVAGIIARRDQVLLCLEMYGMLLIIFLIITIGVAMIPIRAIKLLERQERFLHVDFEHDMEGKELKRSIYKDEHWFIGRSGSYLFLFHKDYIKEVGEISRRVSATVVDVETVDGRKIRITTGNIDLKPFEQMVKWMKKIN